MTGNVENIRHLRDFIASAQYDFDMSDELAKLSCGTAGCIGGHAAMLWNDLRVTLPGIKRSFTFNTAFLAKKLSITMKQVNEMCFMSWSGREYSEVDRAAAVRYLDALAAYDGPRASILKWDDVLDLYLSEMGREIIICSPGSPSA